MASEDCEPEDPESWKAHARMALAFLAVVVAAGQRRSLISQEQELESVFSGPRQRAFELLVWLCFH